MCKPAPVGIPGPLAVLAALLVAAGWLVARILRVLGPLLVVLVVLAYRWHTGAPMRRAFPPRRRYVTRPVRATGQTALSVIVVCSVLWPTVTAAVMAALGLALVASVAVVRYRAWSATRPRRIRVTVPRRPGPLAAPPAALTAAPAAPLTWSAHSDTRTPVGAARGRSAGRGWS